MLHENEIVMLATGLCVLFFVLKNHVVFQRIQGWRLLLGSFCCMLAGWVLTVLEGVVLPDLFNELEHASYLAGAVLLFLWTRAVAAGRRTE